ncbi:MAG: hypothetical protein ACI85O_002828 [Saprospiraceae bacterium]|jgi:hypothetical protein
MKNFGWLFLIFLLPSFGLGQSFTFTSQSALNNFDPTITSISGYMVLDNQNSSEPITNLSPLENLTQIEGNLKLSSLDVTSLEGLNGCTKNCTYT